MAIACFAVKSGVDTVCFESGFVEIKTRSRDESDFSCGKNRVNRYRICLIKEIIIQKKQERKCLKQIKGESVDLAPKKLRERFQKQDTG